MIFRVIVHIRNMLYDKGLISQKQSRFPVISIGNISTGGTGKTPFTLMLAKLMYNQGIPVSLLSSGYGRKGTGEKVIVREGKVQEDITPDNAGDEVLQHAQSGYYTTVIACQPKYKSLDVFTTPVLIDDGFQHRKIYRDVDIVLINDKDLQDSLLPFGHLRETPESLKRADVIVCTDDTPLARMSPYMKQNALFLRVAIEMDTPYPLHESMKNSYDSASKVMAIAGIAHPERFKSTLISNGIHVEHFKWFTDHAEYTNTLVQTLCDEAQAHDCDTILITEKDAVKLRNFADEFIDRKISVAICPIRFICIEGEREFKDRILNICSHYSRLQ